MAVARFLLASSLLLLITFAVFSSVESYSCTVKGGVHDPPDCVLGGTDPPASAAGGMETFGLLGSLMIGWFAAIF